MVVTCLKKSREGCGVNLFPYFIHHSKTHQWVRRYGQYTNDMGYVSIMPSRNHPDWWNNLYPQFSSLPLLYLLPVSSHLRFPIRKAHEPQHRLVQRYVALSAYRAKHVAVRTYLPLKWRRLATSLTSHSLYAFFCVGLFPFAGGVNHATNAPPNRPIP